MHKWMLVTAVFLGLLALSGVALAQSGCPPEARVIVDGPLCSGTQAVTGRVAGTACGDAAVTIRHTATCDGIDDLLVGAGRTTANGDFTVPLSETLYSGHLGCSDESAWINVDVECPCGPLEVREDIPVSFKTGIPPAIPVPQAGATIITGQWAPSCEGLSFTVTDQDGNVIGTGVVQADGSFVIQLLRPLETDEVVFITVVGTAVSDICRFCTVPKDFTYQLGPVSIPESSTLLLLACGLAGLAGVVKARRILPPKTQQ